MYLLFWLAASISFLFIPDKLGLGCQSTKTEKEKKRQKKTEKRQGKHW